MRGGLAVVTLLVLQSWACAPAQSGEPGAPDAGFDAGVAPVIDAGIRTDAGSPGDAGAPDAGVKEADAGTVDAGQIDAGGPDAGAPDSGIESQGPCDPGVLSDNEMPCPVGTVCAVGLDGGYYTGCATPQYSVSNGMVTDELTGLVWQQSAPTMTYTWYASGMSGSVQDYCATLTLGGYQWRVPTVAELYSILDESSSVPAVDSDAFPDTPLNYFWTSVGTPGNAWAVNFNVDFGAKAVGMYDSYGVFSVRCVRSSE